MKVLHVLYQSLPQVSGSSIRSRDILMAQKEMGIDVLAVTSTFQGGIDEGGEDLINGIRYIRTTSKKTTSISDEKKSLFSQFYRFFGLIPFTFKLYKIVSREKPDILHAHAMFYCGLPSIFIGKIKSIPVVYEFRSLWMFQKKKKSKSRLDYMFEKLMLRLELFTLKRAKHSVFLNEDLKSYFTEKGDRFKQSSVINNAVNTSYIKQKQSTFLEESKPKELIFGYIGTITAYEGIEFLIETFQELYEEGIKNKLLIFGDGISKKAIVDKINTRIDIDTIQYKGSLQPEKIHLAYANLDVIINPRLCTNVTNSVTPLKPLEAFAYKKLFIGSNVGGIMALVKHEKTGLLFEAENKISLKHQIKRAIGFSIEERENIINKSLKYVEENKSWNKNAASYISIYKSL